jgi:3-oxoacyl-[acyl-carrier-protein] synthase II
MTFGTAGLNLAGDWQPVAQRPASGGFCLGGLGCFLLLEAADHARARAAAPFARLAHVGTGMAQRQGEDTAAASAAILLDKLRDRLRPGAAVLSAASGVEPAAEASFLAGTGAGPIRYTADMLGHGVESSFPAAIALAALQAQAGLAPQTLVSGFGAYRGEALALVEAV